MMGDRFPKGKLNVDAIIAVAASIFLLAVLVFIVWYNVMWYRMPCSDFITRFPFNNGYLPARCMYGD